MSTRSLVFEIPAPDFMAAVDLQVRLQTTAQTQVMPGDGPVVVVDVPQSRLSNVLGSLRAWLEEYIVGELEVRINQRPFTVRRDKSGIRWRGAGGTELDDVELENRI